MPNVRSLIAFVHDLVAAALAWLLAYWLRFNLDVPPQFQQAALATLPWVVPVKGVFFAAFGLYRGIWRFASLPDLKRIVLAVGTAALATPAVLMLFRVEAVVPRSVMLLDPMLLLLIMGGSRLLYRALKEHRLSAALHPGSRRALVLGAGSAAEALLREAERRPDQLRIVGLLDDDPAKQGRQLRGRPILGPLSDLERWARQFDIEAVVLALPSASHGARSRVTEAAKALGLEVLTVPALEDLVSGLVAISALRPVDLEDLLGRDPVKLDDAGLHRFLAGRTVLVTGAGGSIGSELCRQIARFAPRELVLFDVSEFALYQLGEEFARAHPEQRLFPLVGDVRDAARVAEVMARFRPQVVFHAAAYKHVPLMEDENALEALKNNVLGTHVVARAAVDAGVQKFVMVSTDKAVNPTNVMGASKRLAEMVCQVQQQGGTRFVSVRFGNVLGSSGSVVPKFRAQIEAGGPVTVTHPEITRYFMSIPEAAQLVLQAALMGEGGEIFVLDMGEPVRIVDLARLMIRLSGKTEEEIPIVFTGLRPGEKLYEELLADKETTLPTPHPKLRVARALAPERAVVEQALAWIGTHAQASAWEVRTALRTWVPEYQPQDQTAGSR